MFGVRNAGGTMKPSRDGVAPDDGLPNLVVELCTNFLKTLVIKAPLETLPVAQELLDSFGSFIMRVVDELDHRFSGMQAMRVRDVVHEEQQVVRTRGE